MHRMFSIVVLTLALTSANTYAQDVDLVRGWDAPTVTPVPTPAPAPTAATPPPTPSASQAPPTTGTNWFVLILVLAAIALLLVGTWHLVYRRRRKNETETDPARREPPAENRAAEARVAAARAEEARTAEAAVPPRREPPATPPVTAPTAAPPNAPVPGAPVAQPANRPETAGPLADFRTEDRPKVVTPAPAAPPAQVRPAVQPLPPTPPAPRKDNMDNLDLRSVLDGLPTKGKVQAKRSGKRDKKKHTNRAFKPGRRAHLVVVLGTLASLLGLANTVSAQTVRITPNFVIVGADPNKPAEPVTMDLTISGIQATSLEVPAGGITGTVSGSKATITVDPKVVGSHLGPNNMYLTSATGEKKVVKFYVFGHAAGSIVEFVKNDTNQAIRTAATQLRADVAKAKAEATTNATTAATTAAKAEVPTIARQEVTNQLADQLREGGQLNRAIEDLAARIESRSMQYTSDSLAMAAKENQQGLVELQTRFERQIAELRQELGEIRQAIQTLAAKEVQFKSSWGRRFVGADKTGQLAPELIQKEEK